MRPGLGEILSRSGALTLDGLRRAADWQKSHGGTIERALLASGALSEEALTVALGSASGLEGVSRERLLAANFDCVTSLPADARKRLRALPFDQHDSVLFVAVSDPDNPILVTGLEAATGHEIKLFAVIGPVLEDSLSHWERIEYKKTQEQPPKPEPEEPAPDEAIERLGLALIAETIRGGASGVEVGVDSKGGYAKAHLFGRPPLTRRMQADVAKLLLSWLRYRLRHGDPENRLRFYLQLDSSRMLVVEKTEAGPEGMRLEFREEKAPAPEPQQEEESEPAPAPEAVAQPMAPPRPACDHSQNTGDVFCPSCGEPI